MHLRKEALYIDNHRFRWLSSKNALEVFAGKPVFFLVKERTSQFQANAYQAGLINQNLAEHCNGFIQQGYLFLSVLGYSRSFNGR